MADIVGWERIYPGGYLEGDPLLPLSPSASLGLFNVVSVLHAIYVSCIRPYVGPDTVALEIGPGRGAWTRALLGAKEVWCLDVLSAEHNGFHEYLGRQDHVHYFQVADFECSPLPDDHFTYLFSFGCFCHLTLAQIEDYARHLLPKLRSGCHVFWMVADYDKLNAAFAGLDRRALAGLFLPPKARYAPLKLLLELVWRLEYKRLRKDKVEDPAPSPGRWYHGGAPEICQVLEKVGYKVLQQDVGASPRDPIIHFVKP